jgi:hypothetical protein
METLLSNLNSLSSLKGHSDLEILKRELGHKFCSEVKSNWIAASGLIDFWSNNEQNEVKQRIERANTLTSELEFHSPSFFDWEAEEDRIWDAGFTLKVNRK